MSKLLLLSLILLVAEVQSAFAQTYVIPHIDAVNLRVRGGAMVDRWYLASRGYWDNGWGIGADVRHHFKKFYLQTGLTFSENMPNVYFINTDPQKLYLQSDPRLYELEFETGGTTPRFLRLSMPISVGATIKKNRYIGLRGLVGIMPVYRFSYHNQGKDWSVDYEVGTREYTELKQYVVVSRIVGMHQPFELHVSAGLGLDIWRFSVDVRRSVALTDLANDIQFEGKTYPFSWKGDQVTVSVGWKFRIDKNRPRKHKKNAYF